MPLARDQFDATLQSPPPSRLEFGDRRHHGQHKLAGGAGRQVGQVGEQDARLACVAHALAEEIHVTREVVELGDDQRRAGGAAEAERLGDLGAVGALAALHLGIGGGELRAGQSGEVAGDGFLLGLQPEPGLVWGR